MVMPGLRNTGRRMMIDDLVRPHLREFRPYSSARIESSRPGILLDANELTSGSPVMMGTVPLNRYPDPLQRTLRERIARYLGVAPDMIFAGVGSDEVIDLLIRLFCRPGEESVAILEPTYGVYRVAANLNDVRVIGIELDERFQPDPAAVLGAVRPETKMIFCCSPNNPTGNILDRSRLETLCRDFGGLVVVDEAYVEFSSRPEAVLPLLRKYRNLIILRTFSKAWGLAGIRLGYCAADPAVVSYLHRIKAPYNLNSASAALAQEAMALTDFLPLTVQAIAGERARVAGVLGGRPCVVHVYPSEANFLLVEFRESQRVYDLLCSRGIIVRRRAEPRLKDCLRITIGTPAENDLLLSILSEIP